MTSELVPLVAVCGDVDELSERILELVEDRERLMAFISEAVAAADTFTRIMSSRFGGSQERWLAAMLDALMEARS